MASITAALTLERALHTQGHTHIAGLDEAGRGAWAGPVMAAAVILPMDHPGLPDVLQGVNDSKQLTPRRREALFDRICSVALAVGVGSAPHTQIDADGIVPATRAAMLRALRALALPPSHLLIDYVPLPESHLPYTAITKGDARSLSIAAASIVAKVTRDRLMQLLHEEYPGYGFDSHKGYGVRRHREALERFGPCGVHRRTFAPIRRLAQLPLIQE